MLVHNEGWRIERTGAAEYHLLPPPDAADRTPIPLPANPPVHLRPTG